MIKKLDFSKSKSLGEDMDIIVNKIDEIVDVVNNISCRIATAETTCLNAPKTSVDTDGLTIKGGNLTVK